MNPRWLEDRIIEILEEVKALKEIVKAVPTGTKENKYPNNKK